MISLQKMGGVAALYMAAAYAIGIVLFVVVLDYPHMLDPAQRVALLVDKSFVIYLTNMILYVVFGVFLIVFVLALHERLKAGASAVTRTGAIIGIVWAGSLIASGMVANAGIPLTAGLFAKDPVQAALVWSQIETVASGLGNGNGEILGGMMTLLLSWAGLRGGNLPRLLNYLGLVVGAVGIVSIAPGLADLAGIFGIGQIVWFVGLALVMFRASPRAA